MNPEDNQSYWRYTNDYFEKDRPKKDWSRLMDIYGNELPPEIKEFDENNKHEWPALY